MTGVRPIALPWGRTACYSYFNFTFGNLLESAVSVLDPGALSGKLRDKRFDWAERRSARGCQGTVWTRGSARWR